MHVCYKFGLIIFILSNRKCYTHTAPTNETLTFDDYVDDYTDDYYDQKQGETVTYKATTNIKKGTSTTEKSSFSLFTLLEEPNRSDNVLEPYCPKACICMDNYKHIECSHSLLTQIPKNLPRTVLIIDLSYNKISQIYATDFKNCTKVREINLSNNDIKTIDRTVKALYALKNVYKYK